MDNLDDLIALAEDDLDDAPDEAPDLPSDGPATFLASSEGSLPPPAKRLRADVDSPPLGTKVLHEQASQQQRPPQLAHGEGSGQRHGAPGADGKQFKPSSQRPTVERSADAQPAPPKTVAPARPGFEGQQRQGAPPPKRVAPAALPGEGGVTTDKMTGFRIRYGAVIATSIVYIYIFASFFICEIKAGAQRDYCRPYFDFICLSPPNMKSRSAAPVA